MTKSFEFIYHDKVRYCDCDMHQHLNHAKYLAFFEQARIEYLGKIGFKPSSDFRSIPFILASVHCEYKAPAHLNDEVIIPTGITKIGTKSIRFEYELRNAKTKELYAEAYTVMVMFDYDKKESIPVSDDLKQRIAKLQEN